jgi:epoxyqueuosine reductase
MADNDQVDTFAVKVKQQALRLGFQKVGIAKAEPLKAEGDRLFVWLAAGYHGEMAWMERWAEKRINPEQILPGAKSIVVAAMNYFTPHDHAKAAGLGKISRYAWGDDYHDVLKEKLFELLDWVKNERPEARGKVCVDTAPVMDKAWAARAGLGWIGKNSNLITTDFGSWVFIGEIILDIDLEYERDLVADHCGSCTACIDACPTDAIVDPYVVDAQKCISYATIELRDDELPVDFEGKMNGWLYGCDICQDVCPWNRFEKPTDEQRFQPRNGETGLERELVLKLSDEMYRERFRKSAMRRAKLKQMKRNAAALSIE